MMRLQTIVQVLEKINRPLVTVLKFAAVWILAGMMFLTFLDVFLRKFFNSPISGAFELIEYMMAIVVPFSVVYCAKMRSHVNVDLLVEHFPERIRKLLSLIMSIITLILFIPITWQTFIYIVDQYYSKMTSSVLLIPIYPFVAMVAVAFAILCLVLITDIFSDLWEVVA